MEFEFDEDDKGQKVRGTQCIINIVMTQSAQKFVVRKCTLCLLMPTHEHVE